MKEEEESWLICNNIEEPPCVEGAIQSNCTVCDCLIWISPSSAQLNIDEPLLKPICLACGKHKLENDPNAEIQPLTKEQQDEIKQYYENEKNPTIRIKSSTKRRR